MRRLLRGFSLAFLLSAPSSIAFAEWTPSQETFFTGSSNNWAKAVLADGRGSIYIGGYAFDGTTYAGWIARYDEHLVLISSVNTPVFLTGSYNDVFSLAMDEAGNVCVAGTLGNSVTGQDFYAGRFSHDLAPLDGVYFPSVGFDAAYGVACTISDFYVTGTINEDLVVMRLDSTSLTTVKSSSTYNGPAAAHDEGRSIALDHAGHIFVGGSVANTSAGGPDLWLGRFNLNTGLESSFTLNGPGSGNDEISSLSFAPDGTLFAGGAVTRSNEDIWIGHFSRDLALLDSVTLDGPAGGEDVLRGVVVDGRGNLYAAGYVNGLTPFFPGGSDTKRDMYLARFSPSPLKLISDRVLAGSSLNQDEGSAFSLDGMGNLYASGLLINGPISSWLARFSIAGDILSAPTETVKKVRVYPSPFLPSRGDAVVAIANLPAGAEVALLTFGGELVARFTADDLGGVAWDGRNSSGQPVASGVYYGVASGRGGSKTFKVVVQR